MAVLDATQPLVISSYTLGTEVSFEDRVRAAAEAGFTGVGLRAENYWDARAAGLDDDAMLAILDRHGVRVMEVEYITAWGTERDRDAAQREKEQAVYHMASTFGVTHVNAGLLERLPVDVITEAFAALCRRASELTVALEFMPYSGVPNLRTGWDIMRGASEPNGALLVDAWHWTRSGTKPADLAPVPADAIVSVQLNDVAEQPMDQLRKESLHHRLSPGQGYGDVAGMVRALKTKGVQPRVITVEVMSDELLARGLKAAAHAVIVAARKVLKEQ